jgi:hypothetical protein
MEYSDAISELMHSIIEVISRRSSEEYAIVVVNSAVQKESEENQLFNMITINNTRYSEAESIVIVDEAINDISVKKLRVALQNLIGTIVTSMGKTAGFFFMKELKNKLSFEAEQIIKKIGVNLDFLQLNYVTDKKQNEKKTIKRSDVVKRFFEVMISILENGISRDYAIASMKQLIKKYQDKYDFFQFISIDDVRYSFGVNEVIIADELDAIDNPLIARALDDIIVNVNTLLDEKGQPSFFEEIKTQLTTKYLIPLEQMGVNLRVKRFSHNVLFKQVMKALIDVLSKTSTKDYAIFAVNSLLRKVDTKYDFLKSVKINSSNNSDDVVTISIMTDLNIISQTDTRRAIQLLLEEIVNSLGEQVSQSFIDEFKNTLDANYLTALEEIGVNLYIIQLKQELLGKNE